MTAENLKEGDIFHWRYKDEKHGDRAMYSRYHCKSMIAVFHKGALLDTYWGLASDSYEVIPNDTVLDFQGNANEMQKIYPGEKVFYRSEDVVDMNHANNSRAPVYVKAGATRDPETMRAYFEYRIERAKSEISSAQRRVTECEDALAAIAQGDLTRNFPVYC